MLYDFDLNLYSFHSCKFHRVWRYLTFDTYASECFIWLKCHTCNSNHMCHSYLFLGLLGTSKLPFTIFMWWKQLWISIVERTKHTWYSVWSLWSILSWAYIVQWNLYSLKQMIQSLAPTCSLEFVVSIWCWTSYKSLRFLNQTV